MCVQVNSVAPNITGQHTGAMLEKVVKQLEKVADSNNGTRDQIIEVLTKSGELAADLQ